jgi:hypothetical protein
MLRVVVLGFATLLSATGVFLMLKGVTGPGVQALGVGIVIILGTLFERWRYTQSGRPLNGRWQPTGERFADPGTGKDMEVLYDPVSGERRYVELGKKDE